jgi:hypothetical protein
MVTNPFEVIEARLSSIENLILDLKHQPKQVEPIDQPEQLLTIKQAAEFLSLSDPTLYTKVSKGELPVMKRSKGLNMETNHTNSPLHKRQCKNCEHKSQLQTIFLYLHDHVATASMVAQATGVPQKCITRYKRYLEKNGMLWEVKRKYCQHTGYKAYYLTTDPAKVPKCSFQLKLF